MICILHSPLVIVCDPAHWMERRCFSIHCPCSGDSCPCNLVVFLLGSVPSRFESTTGAGAPTAPLCFCMSFKFTISADGMMVYIPGALRGFPGDFSSRTTYDILTVLTEAVSTFFSFGASTFAFPPYLTACSYFIVQTVPAAQCPNGPPSSLLSRGRPPSTT